MRTLSSKLTVIIQLMIKTRAKPFDFIINSVTLMIDQYNKKWLMHQSQEVIYDAEKKTMLHLENMYSITGSLPSHQYTVPY